MTDTQEWWDYSNTPQPMPFGDAKTYEIGLGWLDGSGSLVEDWGCGLAYGRRYVTKSRYLGIDGSTKNPFADVEADLRQYTSTGADVYCRHVLEHNRDWPLILQNAVDSFRQRLVLVLFTPFAAETHPNNPGHLTLDISFRREDLTAYFDGFDVREEHVSSDTQYGSEHLFFVERPEAAE